MHYTVYCVYSHIHLPHVYKATCYRNHIYFSTLCTLHHCTIVLLSTFVIVVVFIYTVYIYKSKSSKYIKNSIYTYSLFLCMYNESSVACWGLYTAWWEAMQPVFRAMFFFKIKKSFKDTYMWIHRWQCIPQLTPKIVTLSFVTNGSPKYFIKNNVQFIDFSVWLLDMN